MSKEEVAGLFMDYIEKVDIEEIRNKTYQGDVYDEDNELLDKKYRLIHVPTVKTASKILTFFAVPADEKEKEIIEVNCVELWTVVATLIKENNMWSIKEKYDPSVVRVSACTNVARKLLELAYKKEE